jgi:hypothetical protein
MATPKPEIRTWTRRRPADDDDDDSPIYTCSTDPSLIRLDALGDALASDMLWWAKPLPPGALRRAVEGSLCFGVYFEGKRKISDIGG